MKKTGKILKNIAVYFVVLLGVAVGVFVFAIKPIHEKMVQKEKEQNAVTETLSCTVEDKYYWANDMGGRIIPLLAISFELDANKNMPKEEETKVTYEMWDAVSIGDVVKCNVTYDIDGRVLDIQLLESEVCTE